MPDGKSETPVPGPERRPPPPKSEFGEGPPLSEQELSHERSLLEQAKMVLRRTGSRKAKTSAKTAKALSFMREVIEAWSLADTECWKFVRAWEARRRVERRGWEGEEERFQGKGMFG
ncbi:hypothetical protein LTR48_009272, partial [Friedmanniomyces endolithicus]